MGEVFKNANIFIYSYVFRLQWAHLLDMIQTNFCLIYFREKSKEILLGGFERQKRNGGRGKDDEREEQNVID